jgi:hypothetical protein
VTPQYQLREQAAAAGRRLKEAADRWNATDLSAMEGCAFSLEQSALELHEMLEALRRGMPPEKMAGVAAEVLRLKNEAGRLGRLTDASASFLRCAPGAGAGESEFYGAGAARYSAPGAEPRGTEA